MKTFIIIVLIFLVLRWLLKPFIKFTVQTTVNKMAAEAMKRQQEYQRQTQQKREGTIRSTTFPPRGNVQRGQIPPEAVIMSIMRRLNKDFSLKENS